MLKTRVATLVLVSALLATAVAATAFHSGRPQQAPSHVARVRKRAPGRTSETPAVHRSLVQQLSLDQLAGQRIIYAYAGLEPPPALIERIRTGEAAGVIFFGPNIVSSAQLRAVVAQLQAAAAASPVRVPLLMMTDQEGGLVRRLPGAPQLSEREIGESPDPIALAAAAGRGAGENLASVGLNVNLAPVLDVYRTPGDFIDEYARSYGMSPTAVGELGSAFISAQQRTGVAATAKHFPGLGAAERGEDTDEQPVTLDLSAQRLRTIDEAPYRAAIAAGVRLVMLSWATYPALDPLLPAGLSTRVIEGELRARLGFHGVTITDEIGAGALAGFGSFGQRGVLAASAGADLLLCSVSDVQDNSPRAGISVLDALTRALAQGRLSRASAEQAAERVLALRASM